LYDKSLIAAVKQKKKEKKLKEKKEKKKEKQKQAENSEMPVSPTSNTMSSSSEQDESSNRLSRNNSSTSFGNVSFITPEMALLEEEEAMMLTSMDADMEAFTMTGNTTDCMSDEEVDDDELEDGEE